MVQFLSGNFPAFNNPNLPVQVVEQIIETQQQEINLQMQELKLREKEIEVNAQLAEKQLSFEMETRKTNSVELRKTMRTASAFIIIFFILFLCFFGYCIESGHDSFALKYSAIRCMRLQL